MQHIGLELCLQNKEFQTLAFNSIVDFQILTKHEKYPYLPLLHVSLKNGKIKELGTLSIVFCPKFK